MPDSTQAVTDPYRTEHATSMTQEPTLSHSLAQQAAVNDDMPKGAAQIMHDKEVVDLGWNEPRENIAAPLVGGMNNEELWMLIRRFNKVRLVDTVLR